MLDTRSKCFLDRRQLWLRLRRPLHRDCSVQLAGYNCTLLRSTLSDPLALVYTTALSLSGTVMLQSIGIIQSNGG